MARPGVGAPARGAGGGPGVVLRVLHADQPRRHVVAAARRGSEGAPGLSRVLAALQQVAAARAGARTAPADGGAPPDGPSTVQST
jgi:hypothetical protein